MRILIASSAHLPTSRAYGIAISKTARAMVDLGHEVTLFVPSLQEKSKTQLELESTAFPLVNPANDLWLRRHSRLAEPFGPLMFHMNRLHVAREFSGFSENNHFDLVWTRDVLLANARTSIGCRIVLEEHHIPSNLQKLRYKRLLARNVTGLSIVAISERIRESMIRLGYPSEVVSFEPSGVATEFFGDSRHVANDSDRRKVGYFGSASVRGSDKGVLDLLRNSEVASSQIKHDLYLVGITEAERVELIRRAKSVGLTLANVVLVPSIPHSEVPALMAGFDALVAPFPDNREMLGTSPLKLLEYAASGLPIVATTSPAVRNVLPMWAFYPFNFGDPLSFIQALQRALSEHHLRATPRADRVALAKKHEWTLRTDRILRFSESR